MKQELLQDARKALELMQEQHDEHTQRLQDRVRELEMVRGEGNIPGEQPSHF